MIAPIGILNMKHRSRRQNADGLYESQVQIIIIAFSQREDLGLFHLQANTHVSQLVDYPVVYHLIDRQPIIQLSVHSHLLIVIKLFSTSTARPPASVSSPFASLVRIGRSVCSSGRPPSSPIHRGPGPKV